jgi:hypothetical protein
MNLVAPIPMKPCQLHQRQIGKPSVELGQADDHLNARGRRNPVIHANR